MLKKISTIVMIILFAATAVVGLLFTFGGEVQSTVNGVDYEPRFTESLIYLIYAFVAIAALIVVGEQAVQFVKKAISEPKAALKSIGGIALLVILLVATYCMSSGEELTILGESEPVSSTWIKLVDMQLYSTYILTAIGFILVAVGGFAKKIK